MQTVSVQCFNYGYHYDKTFAYKSRTDVDNLWANAIDMCLDVERKGYKYQESNYYNDISVARCMVTFLAEDGSFKSSDVMTVDKKQFITQIPEMEEMLRGKIKYRRKARNSEPSISSPEKPEHNRVPHDNKYEGYYSHHDNPDEEHKFSGYIAIGGIVLLIILILSWFLNH